MSKSTNILLISSDKRAILRFVICILAYILSYTVFCQLLGITCAWTNNPPTVLLFLAHCSVGESPLQFPKNL